MSSTELDIYRGAPLADRQQYALTIARAKAILPGNLRAPDEQETAARAFLIMETGDMLGLHPMAALAGVNVIEGKPALSSGLMSAVVRDAGHKLHVTESGTIEGGDYKATATLTREDDPEHPFSSTWTPHRAQRAGLCKYEQEAGGIWKVTARSERGKALPWESYTESLCKSRAISEVARDGAQDALLGLRYTPEELESGVEDHTPAAIEQPTEEAKPVRKPARGTQGTKRKTAATAKPTPVEDAPSEPQEPQEDIVDAEVVEEPQEDPAEAAEREERARIAAEQEAAQRAKDEAEEPAPTVDVNRARNADALPGESEPDYQHRKMREREAERKAAHEREMELAKAATESIPGVIPGVPDPEPEHMDTATGVVYDSAEELDAAIKARVQANRAARATGEPSAFDVARSEEPENWERQAEAAETLDQLKLVWDDANKGTMSTAQRLAIIKRKAQLSAPAEDPQE